MDRIVLYIPSYNDSELVQQSLGTVGDWDVVISDNASDAPHRRALAQLAGERVRVIHQEKQLGRVGNWNFCVKHFVASGARWMKFLPAGDRHKSDSLAACQRALARYPDARFVITNVEIVWPERRVLWASAVEPALLQPAELVRDIVARGNVFLGLQTALIHADALSQGFAFGEEVLSYCADFLFLLGIAAGHPTLFYPEVVTEFVSENRKTFKVGQTSVEHFVEEALVRMRAADLFGKLSGDRLTRNQLHAMVGHWLRTALDKPPGAA